MIALAIGLSLATAEAFAQARIPTNPLVPRGPVGIGPAPVLTVVPTPGVTTPTVTVTGPAGVATTTTTTTPGTNPAGPMANDPAGRPVIAPIGTRPGRGRAFLPDPTIDPPPSYYGVRPYGPVVIDNLDEYRRQLIAGRVRFAQRVRRAPRQPPQQIVLRSGFNPPPAGEQRYVPNEVLLHIAGTVPDATLVAIARQHRLTQLESQEFTATSRKLFRWRINDGRPVAAVIRTLMSDVRVLGAQPNYLYTLQEEAAGEAKPAEAKPDPRKPDPVDEANSAQYALAKLRLPQAHALSKGEGVVIAVIDTPLDETHPELAGVVSATFNAMGTAEKPLSHGTAMAGAIAAHGKLVGTAPGVKLLSVQAFGRPRNDGSSFNIMKGIEWAMTQNANIINMSFAGPTSDADTRDMIAAAHAKGIVLIAAAGNGGPRARAAYPGADPNVIAVTAIDANDKLFEKANRGSYIAVAAPGVDILSAAPDGGYQTSSGTSIAAAEVTGIVALLIARDRKLDSAAVRKLLTSTARDLGPAGPDDQFGAGIVDAYAALIALGGKPTADVAPARTTP